MQSFYSYIWFKIFNFTPRLFFQSSPNCKYTTFFVSTLHAFFTTLQFYFIQSTLECASSITRWDRDKGSGKKSEFKFHNPISYRIRWRRIIMSVDSYSQYCLRFFLPSIFSQTPFFFLFSASPYTAHQNTLSQFSEPAAAIRE